jgi:hexosaminidase
MASGVWTWRHFWYDKTITHNTVGPCIKVCRNTNVKQLFFTTWGDDGAYCEFDSALAGLAWSAGKVYLNGEEIDTKKLSQRFAVICGAVYDDVEKTSALYVFVLNI